MALLQDMAAVLFVALVLWVLVCGVWLWLTDDDSDEGE